MRGNQNQVSIQSRLNFETFILFNSSSSFLCERIKKNVDKQKAEEKKL